VKSGEQLPGSEALLFFLHQPCTIDTFTESPETLQAFGRLDDHDIWGALKLWQNHNDFILAKLTSMLLERKLFQIILSNDPIKKDQVEKIRTSVAKQYRTLRAEASYFYSYGSVTNEAYTEGQKINILTKGGELLDIAQASDLPNIKAISKIVKKNYLCWPKNVSL
jgi:hypothetical protein